MFYTERMRRNVASCIILVLFTVCLYGVGLVYGERLRVSSDGANLFVSSLTSRSFDVCDSLVYNSNYRFNNVSFARIVDDPAYYEVALNALVDSCSSFQLISIDEFSDGWCRYTYEVEITPYVVLDDIYIMDISEDIESYKAHTMSDYDFSRKLEEVYWRAFVENCFVKDESQSITMQVSITEHDNKVYNSVEFIDNLLETSNIAYNIRFYEENISRCVENVISNS